MGDPKQTALEVRATDGGAGRSPNPKASAWDLIGALYWKAGYRGGPTPRDIEKYLEGVGRGTRVVVVGASTRHLIAAALERGAEVTVLDFASTMCRALASDIRPLEPHIVCCDITLPVKDDLCGCNDLLLADRLLNRFVDGEVVPALTQMLRLLKHEGEIRTAIRHGLYGRDRPMIDEARRRGTAEDFFDEDTCTIDYGRAGELLELLPAHGEIPRPLLLEFYRRRGPEKRFQEHEIRAYVDAVAVDGRGLMVAAMETFYDVTDQMLYRLRPRHLSREGRP